MLTPKESVLERIEQSFILFKNNFKQIFLPLFIYKILTSGFIFSLIFYFTLQTIDLSTFSNIWTFSWITSIFTNKYFYLFIVFIFFSIAYLLLIIPFFIATIKAIKNSYFEVENNFKDNINYWFSRIFQIFKTYWYIFAYVFLIPALAFIIWSVLLILWEIKNIENFFSIWMSLVYFSVILFFVFFIYRWIETTFSLYSAIDKDEFEKENFEDSISLTKNNWWRILWNMLLVSMILSLSLGLVMTILSIFINIWDSTNLYWAMNQNWLDKEELKKILETLQNFQPLEFIKNLISITLNSILEIFMFVFIYIFYKRIELEKNGDTSSKETLKITENKKTIEEL